MAESKEVNVVVITPERQVLDEVASSVVIPAHDGELGVLNQRAPLMCELGIGQLRYTAGGQMRRVFIDGGFAQVYENHVTVLTNRAMPAEDVTADVVHNAEEDLRGVTGTDPDSRTAHERAQQRLIVLRELQGA